MVVARSARQTKDGTVDVAGAGLSSIKAGDGFVVVSFIEIPASQARLDHKVRIELLDEHGAVVGKPLTRGKTIEGRPNGKRRSWTAAVISTVRSFDHQPGRYEVRVAVDHMSDDGWRCSLSVN